MYNVVLCWLFVVSEIPEKYCFKASWNRRKKRRLIVILLVLRHRKADIHVHVQLIFIVVSGLGDFDW